MVNSYTGKIGGISRQREKCWEEGGRVETERKQDEEYPHPLKTTGSSLGNLMLTFPRGGAGGFWLLSGLWIFIIISEG